MKILYFDICSIPLFLMILFICHTRRMTKGSANRLFIVLVLLSLFSAAADLCMEILSAAAPLSGAGVPVCTLSSYAYFILRNANNAVLLLFLIVLTRTGFLLKKKWVRIAFAAPYVCLLIVLAQNLLTHNVFTVTAEEGYSRAPLILVIYFVALIYGLTGLAYCIFSRRYLSVDKWGALLTIYVLNHVAVAVQFFHPELLLEMFCTAVGEMMIMLSIMRPEERMDNEVGILSWSAYQMDIRNIIFSRENVQIIVIQILNSREIRNYMESRSYYGHINRIANNIRDIQWKHQNRVELYFEHPGTIYIITDKDEAGNDKVLEQILSETGSHINSSRNIGMQFDSQVCIIRCPDDLNKADDIISLGHIFPKISESKNKVVYARDIVHSRTFEIEAHIVEILERAIRDNSLQMYYQPIYDTHSGAFHSAEALARIIDPEYGFISPAVFIPAAETESLIIPLGDVILDQVFRFISEHDLDALGLSYIEINLSVAQCMESSLPDKLLRLQRKYRVDPGRISLEITETTFENINEVLLNNIYKLGRMGYSFALDDYGTGYSSIQRVNNIPFKLIKIDKSMLDEMHSEKGRLILEHTILMMQSIGKQLVAEGAETAGEVEILQSLNCDYIQGFHFSRPLPKEEFISFIKEHK